ncbi:MAG: SRPBCC family protein [Sedimentitalea sp.]
MKTLRLEAYYPVDADRLFALASDLDALEAVTRPWIQFDHLPSGQVKTGQVIDVAVSLLGVFPPQPYRMRVVRCDEVLRLLRSEEEGMGVARFVHVVTVTPEGTGAKLVDLIEIDAGWKTWIVWLWARFLYGRRHKKRLALLGL